MNPGCTVIGFVHAKPGKRDELLKVLQGFVTPTRREPGCADYHLHVDDEDPNRFVFYENFGSRQDFDAHLEMPYLSVLRERADELLDREVEIHFHTMLSTYER